MLGVEQPVFPQEGLEGPLQLRRTVLELETRQRQIDADLKAIKDALAQMPGFDEPRISAIEDAIRSLQDTKMGFADIPTTDLGRGQVDPYKDGRFRPIGDQFARVGEILVNILSMDGAFRGSVLDQFVGTLRNDVDALLASPDRVLTAPEISALGFPTTPDVSAMIGVAASDLDARKLNVAAFNPTSVYGMTGMVDGRTASLTEHISSLIATDEGLISGVSALGTRVTGLADTVSGILTELPTKLGLADIPTTDLGRGLVDPFKDGRFRPIGDQFARVGEILVNILSMDGVFRGSALEGMFGGIMNFDPAYIGGTPQLGVGQLFVPGLAAAGQPAPMGGFFAQTTNQMSSMAGQFQALADDITAFPASYRALLNDIRTAYGFISAETRLRAREVEMDALMEGGRSRLVIEIFPPRIFEGHHEYKGLKNSHGNSASMVGGIAAASGGVFSSGRAGLGW